MSDIHPTIKTEFRLVGIGFDPQAITRIVDLIPTRTWRAGDSVQGTILKRKKNGWGIGIESKDSFSVEEQIHSLLARLEPHCSKILSVCEEFKLETEISCAVYIEEISPSVFLSCDLMKRVVS